MVIACGNSFDPPRLAGFHRNADNEGIAHDIVGFDGPLMGSPILSHDANRQVAARPGHQSRQRHQHSAGRHRATFFQKNLGHRAGFDEAIAVLDLDDDLEQPAAFLQQSHGTIEQLAAQPVPGRPRASEFSWHSLHAIDSTSEPLAHVSLKFSGLIILLSPEKAILAQALAHFAWAVPLRTDLQSETRRPKSDNASVFGRDNSIGARAPACAPAA